MPKSQLSDFTRVFERHTSEDEKNFAMVQKAIEDSEDRLEIKIAKKLDRAVFSMFLTIALPVFTGVVWYMIAETRQTQLLLAAQTESAHKTDLKVEKTSTDVTWIREKLEGYNVIVK